MKTLFFILALAISTNLFSQETAKAKEKIYYCVQVVSTENPERLDPIMFMAMLDRAMVEKATVNGRHYYRVLFIYNTIDDQDSALHNWRHQWKDAIRVTKTESQIQKMYPLFSHD